MPLFQQPPQSICILRLSAIGDVCHVLAVVEQIKTAWPQTQITWIIGKTEYQLMQNVSGIHFVIYDKKSGWKGIWRIWQQLRSQNFDALLNMQTAFRASMLSIGIKAQYKIGFGKQRAREGQWLFTNRKIEDPLAPHVLDGFFAFLAVLGIPATPPQWHLNPSQQDRQYVQQWRQPNQKNLLICPCSSKSSKDWTVEGYAEVARDAVTQGHHVILAGAPTEREIKIAQQIMQKSGVKITNCVGKTTLLQLYALIEQVDLVLTPDSAAAHLATAAKTPVIGLYAIHNPLRTGPYNDLDNVISVYEQNIQQQYAKPSNQLAWGIRAKGSNLMQQISSEQVIKKVRKLLD
ncbi:ADP-heptose--LPS heptosyltransferase I [Mergibacter septicus]|uniref:glycosyltransferase family 9 protein n=1 Tax=Mergibacter septicus TaxID=221402 RepID=UPI001C7801C4|nr:glycosyltransferase family 9 protein [Mergibacter septicus]QDJ13726.1 ADP-heptose--LPS heptosyltransferase I [Mergibacter septicus]